MTFTTIILIIIGTVVLLTVGVGTLFVSTTLKRVKTGIAKPMSKEIERLVKSLEPLDEDAALWAGATKHEDWTLKVKKINLHAEYYPNEGSDKWVILIHGFKGSAIEMRKHAKVFHSWGYNCVLPYNRAHDLSEGKWIGFGWLDSKDIKQWIGKITDINPKAQIAVMGHSMGGATTMMLSGLHLPKNVKCFVEDCGYSSAWDEFKTQLKQRYHLPAFPVLYQASLMCKIICGYSFKQASSVKRLKKCKKPILFIHGTDDEFVPVDNMDRCIEACPAEKEILRIDGAIHAGCIVKDYNRYFGTIKSFTEKYIK